MTANQRAWDLRAKLFALVNEFKDFHGQIGAVKRRTDATDEAGSQSDAFACELAALYEKAAGPSPAYDLFTDAARDRKDQSFGFALPDGVATDFPAQLKALREKASLSREQLADAAGLTREGIRLYELGERSPTWQAVQKLAAALGVPTDVFRDRE